MTYLFPSKQLSMKGGSLQVARHALEEIEEAPLWLQEISGQRPLQLQLEAELGAKETKISGSLGKDTFSFWDDAMQLGAVQFLYKPGQLYLTSQSHLHGKPLQLQAQALFNGSPSLHLLIKEDAQHKGLALQCLMDPKEGYWYVEKAQGELSGLIVQAGRIGKKEQDLCRYEVEVHVDFAKMSALLPKASADMIMTYEIGKGYTYRGTAAVRWAQPVKFVGLAGEVLAKDFVLFGKSMKSLRSFLEMDEMHGQVRGLKLEDDVGILSAKAISFSYLPKEKTYQVEAPLIHVKDLVPAFFLKEAKKKGVEIKNVSFYDIKGKLGDLSSFQAKGSLHFSSISKKEFSFWDIPLSLLKDFGLDPGLLTPSIGEADLSVHHGRIYFTDLRNAYSEEKRSQFYLAEPGTDAYLGLDGSWHVDLKMKQNVVWKVTEDLILSVRGSLDNPKYSLKASSN
jgi:hypothetical protein